MSHHAYASQYRQTSVTSAVLDADPHRLVALTFAGIRNRLRLAIACIENGNLARKGEAISETSALVGHLDGSLDHEAGGEIAGNLSALYHYIQRRLVEANFGNDASILQECDSLVAELEGAWNAIAPNSPPVRSAAG